MARADGGAGPGALIRPAEPGDLDAIRDIMDRAYAPYVPRIGRRPAPMDDDLVARIADGEAFLLAVDGAVQGVAVLLDRPDHLLLDNVAVHPVRQGQGHGRRLVAFAAAEARRRGRDELRLYTNAAMPENVALYLRLGFVETGRGRQAGFDRVFMTLRLA